jgi:hypothetical protein
MKLLTEDLASDELLITAEARASPELSKTNNNY